jgi:hypothetical protein
MANGSAIDWGGGRFFPAACGFAGAPMMLDHAPFSFPQSRKLSISGEAMTNSFDPNNPWHSHVDFLTFLMCWECKEWFERPDWGPTGESFRQWCADVSDRAQQAGWVMIDDRPYCPKCAVKRRGGLSNRPSNQ